MLGQWSGHGRVWRTQSALPTSASKARRVRASLYPGAGCAPTSGKLQVCPPATLQCEVPLLVLACYANVLSARCSCIACILALHCLLCANDQRGWLPDVMLHGAPQRTAPGKYFAAYAYLHAHHLPPGPPSPGRVARCATSSARCARSTRSVTRRCRTMSRCRRGRSTGARWRGRLQSTSNPRLASTACSGPWTPRPRHAKPALKTSLTFIHCELLNGLPATP